MGLLNRLVNLGTSQPDYSAPDELRAVWDRYSEQWPDNNERYRWWKPVSLLPAPKWAIKRAMKLAYAEWPEPIDWTIFSAFFMEFVDLALHLPQKQFDAVERFKKQRIKCGGLEDKYDPLLMFSLISNSAFADSVEDGNRRIIRIRDDFRRSKSWDPVDVDDYEIDAVRRILLESVTEFATLTQEWQFYILSIGRDKFIK